MTKDPDAQDTELTMTVLMTPNMANFYGNVHGGTILKLADEVAYACASRYSGYYVVTLSVDQVTFKEPIYVGELVTFHAEVNWVGRTSIEVGIEVIAEHIQTKAKRHTNTCIYTMVAIDKDRKPTTVKPLELKTEDQKRRFEAAKLRREYRLKQQ